MTMAAVDPITMKLDRLFSATDVNNDGYVDWSDYQRIIDRYLSAYKIDRSDRRAHALTASYQMTWMELLRQGNGNDRLDREQFYQACRMASVDTSRFNMVEGVPHAIFDIMDVDGDNTISQAEYKRYLEVWGSSDPGAMEAFARLDADGDGVISRHEFIRAVREFYYSPDPDAAGSLLLGHIVR